MLSVIVGSQETSLDDGVICTLLGYDGWGMAPLSRLAERGPLQHGDMDLGYHLDARMGSLILGVPTTTLSDMYTRRKQLLDLFKPQNSPKLKWELPNGDVRQIDVHLVDDMSIPWRVQGWASIKVAVALKAPDPAFYYPTQKSRTFEVAGGDQLVFPIVFPIKFASSIINEGENLAYIGTWISYPKFILTGPLENPIITNVTTGDKIELEYNVSAAEVVTIDLTPGVKTIENGSGTNLIGTLSDDSDIGTFHLATAPQAAGGVNELTFQAGGATTDSKIEMKWYDRYVGI